MHKPASILRWIASLALSVGLAACNNDKIHDAYALTAAGQIIHFQTGSTSTNTNSVSSTATVTGLATGESLVQLAYRPATLALYGLSNQNRLCTLDPDSGVATLVSTTPFTTDVLSSPAIAFDPVHDQLRVIAAASASSSGFENLRVDPSDGSLATQTINLIYTNGVTGTPQITGLVYTDPVNGAPSTTLYGLDANSQQLVQIGSTDTTSASDADGGEIQLVGAPGVSFSADLGFSIAPSDGIVYATLAPTSGGASLYSIDLDTGAATALGTVGSSAYTLLSLVIAP